MYEASVNMPACGRISSRSSNAMAAQTTMMIMVSSHFFRSRYCTALFSFSVHTATASRRFILIICRQPKNICRANRQNGSTKKRLLDFADAEG